MKPVDLVVSHGHGTDRDRQRQVDNRTCANAIGLSHDTFAVRFDRLGIENRKRSGEIWLVAEHPGDIRFRRSVQQSLLRIPITNRKGEEQQITFPTILDCAAGAAPIKLHASSDSGSEVRYYVVAGPAEISGDTLRLTQIPPRSKFPVKATVVAWQWGRTTAPLLQSAEPVTQSFLIRRDSKAFVHPGLLHTRSDTASK